jgi:hypothetical protein
MWSMSDEAKSISINALATMPSARLKLADLEFIAGAVGETRRIVLTWSTREIYRVTATNFSAQSPAVKIVQTFEARSIAEFASQAPPGKIYILEAIFESPDGVAKLTLGKDGDLSRNLILSFDGVTGSVPPWFNDIVSKIVAARLYNAGIRELLLLLAAWAPVVLPPIWVPWAAASGRLSHPIWPLVLYLGGFTWFIYAVWAPTIARFVRASSMRVRPLFTDLLRPQLQLQPLSRVPKSKLVSSRLKEFRAELKVALRRGWVVFRQSDRQFIVSLLALLVAMAALINDLTD